MTHEQELREIVRRSAELAELIRQHATITPPGPREPIPDDITPEQAEHAYLEIIRGAPSAPPRAPLNPMPSFDYSSLPDADAAAVEHALSIGDPQIAGYIPDKALQFVSRNYRQFAEAGILEQNWMQAYLHASHLNHVPLSLLQEIFDACDKKILQQHYPIPPISRFSGERFSVFRGCAGPEHRMGMSWLTSLDKAIWYAAHHAAYYELTNLAVYAAVVDRAEIYCCGEHYDFDYIVRPKEWWRVDVPNSEYRLDRPR